MDPTKILDSLKLSPRILLGVALGTGLLVFASPSLIGVLGMAKLMEAYRGWVGGGFVISSALLLSHGLAKVGGSASVWIAERRTLHRMRKSLSNLSPAEKALLSEYLDKTTMTGYHEVSDGIVNGLVAKQILYRASNLAMHLTTFPFNLQPWAWEHLRKHPKLLEGGSSRKES